MYILVLPVGFILWYLAYKAKPIINDEVTIYWGRKNIDRRNRLLNIINKRILNYLPINFDQSLCF